MRFAIIESGCVANIAEAEEEFGVSQGWVPATDDAQKGDLYDPQALNLFSKPTAPVVVPQVVDMAQARLALLAAGKLGAVEAAIASLPSPQKEAAQIEWEFRPVVHRNSPLVVALGQQLGLDLDALFIAAASH
jgi:hypothetical protein